MAPHPEATEEAQESVASMICLGLNDGEKAARIARYAADHGVSSIVVLSPARFKFSYDLPVPGEWIEWAEIIQYKFYYRLLQEIGRDSLVVVNECLRTQNRHDLTYNCMRLFIAQAGHVLVFQYLPLIDKADDFAILFDFDTQSRWKREPFAKLPLQEATIEAVDVPVRLRAIPVATDAKTRAAYAAEKRNLIDGIGLRDPHTIPRQLHLVGGRTKLAHVEAGRAYVGRNDRFKAGVEPYKADAYQRTPYTIFEWPHNFIDFADFVALSGQSSFDALMTDLKVDGWYFDRYVEWTNRIRDAQAILRG